MVLGQIHKHTCSTAPLSGPAETAVTDTPAWGAEPLRVQEGILDLFSVAVLETWPAELPSNTHTFWISAVGLGVCGFLTTLMARGASGTVVNLLPDVDADVVQFSLSDFLHRPHDMRNSQCAVITASTWFPLLFIIVIFFAFGQD